MPYEVRMYQTGVRNDFTQLVPLQEGFIKALALRVCIQIRRKKWKCLT